jgi:ubiquinone/menaquinone biosynthesis C-methylase UbiE
MVGLDLFRGMLQQAKHKASDIAWVRGDGARLPFADQAFDFVTNQFAFHHVLDKRSMIGEIWRVLRPRGRFVMTNIDPHQMPGWALYRYFPTALEGPQGLFSVMADHGTAGDGGIGSGAGG